MQSVFIKDRNREKGQYNEGKRRQKTEEKYDV